ncbi:hypothetical protein [Alloscardovia omnicolens]
MQCKNCGKLFKPSGHGRKPSFCSDRCRVDYNRTKKRFSKSETVSPSVKVDKSGKVLNVPSAVAREVREEITGRDFEKMMGHGYADDLEFVKQVVKRAMTDAETPASALPGLSKTLLEASKQIDDLDPSSNESSLADLLKGDTSDDVIFHPEAG